MRVSIVRNLAMKKTPGQAVGTGERGFSLIELLIAMVVTLIVGGAVLMLLVQANQSFQTQPEMTERQQNIRAAMDLIMRDIANAGAGLPHCTTDVGVVHCMQVFTPGLNGAGPVVPEGGNSDILRMLTNDTGRDPVPACQDGGVNVRIMASNVPFAEQMPVLLLMKDGTYSIRTITEVQSDNSSGGGCTGGTRPRLIFNQGQDDSGGNPGGSVCGPNNFGLGTSAAGCSVQAVLSMNVVQYYIGPAPDDAAMPVLWREVNGAAPGQQVARGIEDMQVTYRSAGDIVTNPTGSDTLPDEPTNVTTSPGLDSLTVEVQVVLAARGGLLVPAGQGGVAVALTRAADGTSAYRGSLRSRAAPRSALVLAGGDLRWQ